MGKKEKEGMKAPPASALLPKEQRHSQLYLRFKAICASKGENMNEVLYSLIEEYVERSRVEV